MKTIAECATVDELLAMMRDAEIAERVGRGPAVREASGADAPVHAPLAA